MKRMTKNLYRFGLVAAMLMLIALGIPMALSADTQIPRKEAGLQSYPVTSGEIIYKGAVCCVDEDGYLVAGADTAGYKFAGIAYEQVDNSAGSDGDEWCRVHTEGVFQLTCTSIAQTMVGEKMYITDDATIDDQSTNWICCGTLVQYVSATSGWVDIGQKAGGASRLLDGEKLIFGDDDDAAIYWDGSALMHTGPVEFNGNVVVDAGASFTCDNVTARIAQGITGLTVSDHPTFDYIVLSTAQGVTGLGTGDHPTFDYISLSTSQGVTGLTTSDSPTFAALTVGYVIVNGTADYPLNLEGCTPNVADIKLNNNQIIRNKTGFTSRAAVRAALGDAIPLGSIAIGDDARATTKPDVYIKVLAGGGDTDWERVVTQASD